MKPLTFPRFFLLAGILAFAASGLAGSPNLALNRPGVASSHRDYTSSTVFALDGATSGKSWMSIANEFPQWIEVDLGQNAQVDGLRIVGAMISTSNLRPKAYQLQHWDGTAWQAINSGSNLGTNDYSVSFAPVLTGRRVRLYCTEGEGIRIGLHELEIQGVAHALQLSSSSPAAAGATWLPAAPVTVTFNAPVQGVNLAGIVLERASDGVDVAGVSASISGATLTISHNALAWGTAYRVRIPAGSVELVSDPSVDNGPIDFEFTVLPQLPQVAAAPNAIANPADPWVVTFDRPVQALNLGLLSAIDPGTGAAFGGLSPSVSGATLTISHPGMTPDATYLLEIPAGALEDSASGADNPRTVLAHYAGDYTLIDTTFATGMDGWTTAVLQGVPGITSAHAWTRKSDQWEGPTGDFTYVWVDLSQAGDYLATPALDLDAARTYALAFRGSFGSNRLSASLNDALTTEGATPLTTFPGTSGYQDRSLVFSPAESGSQRLLFTLGGTGYTNVFMDGVTLREAVPPVLRVTSPAAGASYNEGAVIPLSADAVGLSGELASVTFADDGAPLATLSAPPFAYDWSYYLPGQRVLSVTATDTHGVATTREVDLTVNFADGTLSPYIHYTFDGGEEGWTGIGVLQADTGGSPGMQIYNQSAATDDTALQSPKVYLFAGETYTIQFRARESSSGAVTLHFAARAAPGEPAPAESLASWTLAATETLHSATFTVPADGGYYLTLFQVPTINILPKMVIDDVRLIGNFNSAPAVAITAPADGIRTVEGATVQIAASASDSDGTVTEVRFRRGLAVLGSDTTAPYSYTWTNIPEGEHPLNALAIDNALGETVSATVNLTARRNELDIATHVGGAASDDEAVRAALYQPDGTLVLAGYTDPGAFPGVTPLYLNGAAPGDRGFIARLSGDGTQVLSLTIIAARVVDLAQDAAGNLYAAAMDDGFIKLNPAADTVIWAKTYPGRYVHRVDAGPSGIAAAIHSTNAVHTQTNVMPGASVPLVAADGTDILTLGGASQNTTDLAVDEVNATVWLSGWKNIIVQDDSAQGSNPVDIPVLIGRYFDNTVRVRGYDWGNSDEGVRYINYNTNNMADTRSSRIVIGADGLLYATYEFDGGNTPLRWDPYDITLPAEVVGGDTYHTMSNTTTVPKLAVVRYDPVDGAELLTQFYTNRLDSGLDNTVDSSSGNIAVDAAGRVHTVGVCASGLAPDTDFLPGAYRGGAWILVYSPDFSSREFIARLTTGGQNYAVAVAPDGRVAFGGSADDETFLTNAWQAGPASASDAFFTVGHYDRYFKFQVGAHPRLAFSAEDIPGLRDRLGRAPYSDMKQALLDYLADTSLHEIIDVSYDHAIRAQVKAFLYVLTGDEARAQEARTLVELALDNSTYGWANPAAKGLASYWLGTRVAYAYDWCAGSAAWDSAFSYRVSKALLDMGTMIVENGGTEQNTSDASNWQGNRGASGGICLLATDHTHDGALLDAAWNKAWTYLNANLGNDASTRGWNPEGLGYTYYPMGNFVGPFGIAMARANPARDMRAHTGLQRAYWTLFTAANTAIDAYGSGGIHPDWSNDNPAIRGEGTYGQAFHFLPDDLLPGGRWSYDRLMGAASPHGANWDIGRAGAIWGYLYYPEDLPAADPLDSYAWHIGSLDDGAQGIGIFTFRDNYSYATDGDFIAQFNARTRAPGGNNGPDGLGFRLIGEGAPLAVGGGRDNPGKKMGQATLYPAFPSSATTEVAGTGTIIGTPLARSDGGGHVIAQMATSNVGVTNHKRWFTTSYDSAATGAAATVVIADTSTNGLFWHMPTFHGNSVSIAGNTFTITAQNGATLKGTVLYPASVTITTGEHLRGSQYSEDELGDDILYNKYISFGSVDGDYLVVLTIQPSGSAHPSVSKLSGTVADALVQVGAATFTHQADTMLYNGAAYAHPDATVTFDAGSGGSITAGAAVQTVAYGAGATAPGVTPDSGFVFLGWDKPFDPVVRSMTVTARYAALEPVPTAPANLRATAVSSSAIELTWQDRSYGETGFVVERSLDGVSWSVTHTAPAGATAHTDSGLVAETQYLYRVKATGTGGDSAWCAVASATTLEANVAPVFTSAPVTLAHEDLEYTCTVTVSDPDNAFVDITAPVLPAWLTLTDYGTGTAVLSGTPSAADASPAAVTLRVSDGANAPAEQSFAIAINRPPVVTITAPALNPVNIPSGVGLRLEAGASDEAPGSLTWSWSVVGEPSGAAFDDPFAALTGATFAADGLYTLRATASDGTLSGHADLVVAHGVTAAATELRALVNFGGTNYVTADRSLATTTNDVAGQEWGDDGLNDDAVSYRLFSDSVPVNPVIGSNYSGVNDVFYGGWELWNLNAISLGERLALRNDNTNGDSVRIGSDNGANRRNYGMVFWKKADFLNGGASGTVRLEGDAVLSARLGNNANHFVIRFAVKQAGQWYLSQASLAVAGSFSITDWTAARWAAYNPVAALTGLRANGTGAAADLSYGVVTMTAVEAVGIYAESLNNLAASDRYIELRELRLEGLVEVTPNVGPAVDAGADFAGEPGVIVNLSGSASDDGLPAPANLVLEWSHFSGAGAVLFGDVSAAATTATFDAGGVHVLRLSASDGQISTFDDVTVTVAAAYTPLEQWRLDNFGTTANAGDAADDADPERDGIPNFLEYALGGEPDLSDPGILPHTGLNGPGTRLTLTFHRARADLTYTVEGCGDLATWSAVATDPGNVGEQVTVEDSADLAAGPRFLRLRVE